MDADFARPVAQWRDFFAAIAGVSATLVGLHFVALAINPVVMGNRRPDCGPGPARPSAIS